LGPGRVKLPSSLVAFLKPNFSYQYQYAEGVDGMGPKHFGTMKRKKTYMMTTNNLSLKSHVLTETDLPIG